MTEPTDLPDLPDLPDPSAPSDVTSSDASPTGEATGTPRRNVLKWMAAGGVGAAAVGAGVWTWNQREDDPKPTPTADPDAPWALDERIMVVVELGGGNDGWSTLVPFGHGTYHDLRPTLALDGDEVIDLGEGWGVNERLRGLQARGLAMVAGVGSLKPNLSHFEMNDRWARGDPGGEADREGSTFPTGFLGRVCDVLGKPGELTGVSLRYGEAPTLRAERVATIGVGDITGNPLADPTRSADLHKVLAALTAGSSGHRLEDAREQIDRVIGMLDLIDELPPAPSGYPITDLGKQLSFTSQLIHANAGLRVIHVPMGMGNRYDTHKNHRKTHNQLMTELNGALSVFIDDLRAHGIADQVLIATTSEFGRRAEEHSDGLDHGTASTLMVVGNAAVPGIHGEHPSLTDLDDTDNQKATVTFDHYYATLASWFGIEPEEVLLKMKDLPTATPIEGVIRT